MNLSPEQKEQAAKALQKSCLRYDDPHPNYFSKRLEFLQTELAKVGLAIQPTGIVEAAISSVLHIRCAKHYMTPQQNKNEHSGGECGGCIAEERDWYKLEYEALKAVIDIALEECEKRTGLKNAGLVEQILAIQPINEKEVKKDEKIY
jgi:hypothetical protein